MAGEWLTAREIAEAVRTLGVPGLPKTQQAILAMAKREGWTDLPTSLARVRAGREAGGALEFHLSALPRRLQAAQARSIVQAGQSRAVAVREEDARARMAALAPFDLGARQRQVMEARGRILTAIAAQEAAHGVSRARAIAVFIASAELGDATLREAFGLGLDVLAVANDRRDGREVRLGRSTIYGWYKAWGANGVQALAPVPTREAGTFPLGLPRFLSFWAQPAKPTATDALKSYMATVTDPALALTIDQVRHALGKLSPLERCVGREGVLALKARRVFVSRTFEDLWPADVYVGDGHTFDAEVMDPTGPRAIRPEITTLIDVATRRVVGLSLARKESATAVVDALRRAATQHGIPAIFYSDNGSGYRNDRLEDEVHGLMARLGTTSAHALPYSSQAKGVVERVHQTIWVALARRLPSFIGADMDAQAKNRVHKRSRADLALAGASALLPSWETFRALCDAEVAATTRAPTPRCHACVTPRPAASGT